MLKIAINIFLLVFFTAVLPAQQSRENRHSHNEHPDALQYRPLACNSPEQRASYQPEQAEIGFTAHWAGAYHKQTAGDQNSFSGGNLPEEQADNQTLQQSKRAQKAKEVLDKFSARAKEYTSFKTSFTFLQMGYDEEISYSYKGKLYLEGEKYKMDLPQSTIFSNGEKVWQYLSDVNEVTITHKQDDGSLMSNPLEIFTFYQKDFKYMYRETQAYNGDEITVIDLFPKDIEASDYSRIRVKINMQKMIIHSIKYFGKGGVHYRVDIKDFNTDTTYSEGFFTFNKAKYEGVEVIDMR